MRDEWKIDLRTTYGAPAHGNDPGPSQGLTRVGRQSGVLDRAMGLTMAHKAMKLKLKGTSTPVTREVSERRQVGDAESMMTSGDAAAKPWWRNVSMEDAL